MPYNNQFHELMDPAHVAYDLHSDSFNQMIWFEKYRWEGEDVPFQSFIRVASALHSDPHRGTGLYDAMSAGLFCPGGRIVAGAGTTKRVTLNNCYVNKTVKDELEDICTAWTFSMLTQQQGGGIGTDFSTLRPENAVLRRTGSAASGPIPFMHSWDSGCVTIRSAGDRRGAMMGTMCDTHPDLLKFITVKQTKNALTNFNISILVSDAFMEAIREDEDWVLYFEVPPIKRDPNTIEYDFVDDQGTQQYVYSIHKARDLWATITKATYEYSEPGVIFIDRINDLNNLRYCEQIRCTNPCGEQPLPANGSCNLGANNLARMVMNPFGHTGEPRFNFSLLDSATRIGIRALDRVIDITNYPLKEQQEEQFNKRRIGLGVMGLADALAQMCLRYGSPKSLELADQIMYTIAQASYDESADLAAELGPFPLYDPQILESPFLSTRVDYKIREKIKESGLRNGVLLTCAPIGTTAPGLMGNPSSGIEAPYDHEPRRNVRQNDGNYKQFDTVGFGAAFYRKVTGKKELPAYFVTSTDLTIEEHIAMQAACQRHVDASISKTCNIPKDMPYEQFAKVYDLAYSMGCKGCTTYRPSDVRGSILVKANESNAGAGAIASGEVSPRPAVLSGITHKIRWPSMDAAIYLTLNYDEQGLPCEVFFSSKDGRYHDWMTATSLMITSLLRKGGPVAFIAEDLKQVRSFGDYARLQGPNDEHPQFYGSLPAYIGAVLESYLSPKPLPRITTKGICPKCHQAGIVSQDGCKSCTICGYTSCD